MDLPVTQFPQIVRKGSQFFLTGLFASHESSRALFRTQAPLRVFETEEELEAWNQEYEPQAAASGTHFHIGLPGERPLPPHQESRPLAGHPRDSRRQEHEATAATRDQEGTWLLPWPPLVTREVGDWTEGGALSGEDHQDHRGSDFKGETMAASKSVCRCKQVVQLRRE